MSIIDAIPRTYEQLGEANALRARTGQIYGQALADIGSSIATLPAQFQQRRSQALRAQELQLQLRKQQREEAADLALQTAFSSGAINQDGTINQPFLIQHLASTPAAPKIPQVLEGLTRMQEMSKQLQVTSGKAQDSEDDILGAIYHSADFADHPEDKGGIALAGIASAQKQGSISPDRAKREIASMMGDDGNPDPAKVAEAIKRGVQGSKEQRNLAEQELRIGGLTEERKAKTDQIKLQRYANQLASATNQAAYARRYQGIEPEFRDYFDAPEDWNPESSRRAVEATMTPANRIAERRADDAAKAADARAAAADARESRLEQRDADRLGVEKGNLDVARAREKRLQQEADDKSGLGWDRDAIMWARATGGGKATPAESKAAENAYKAYVSQYNTARREERMRASQSFEDTPKDTYQPPPSFDKWAVMTPIERQNILRDPKQRIDDAEMLKRQGGAAVVQSPTPTPAPAAAPAAAAPAPTPAPAAPPAAAKTVTMAELKALAQKKGTSVDVQRKRYEGGGYTVLP